MATLAIETSTAHGSVAVSLDREVIFHEKFTSERRHSAALFAALERARGQVPRIQRIAVGLGPGSYAGVRIAIAVGLGMELALGATLVGIPSIATLETKAPGYLFAGDARQERFYFAVVDSGVCIEGPLLASEDEVRSAVDRFSTWPFYSNEKLEAFPTGQVALPSAAVLARLASEERGIVQIGDLEPLYLREPSITHPSSAPLRPPTFR